MNSTGLVAPWASSPVSRSSRMLRAERHRANRALRQARLKVVEHDLQMAMGPPANVRDWFALRKLRPTTDLSSAKRDKPGSAPRRTALIHRADDPGPGFLRFGS